MNNCPCYDPNLSTNRTEKSNYFPADLNKNPLATIYMRYLLSTLSSIIMRHYLSACLAPFNFRIPTQKQNPLPCMLIDLSKLLTCSFILSFLIPTNKRVFVLWYRHSFECDSFLCGTMYNLFRLEMIVDGILVATRHKHNINGTLLRFIIKYAIHPPPPPQLNIQRIMVHEFEEKK